MTQEWSVIAHLKGLPIPVLDLLNRRHATHVVREFIKFLGSMRQSDGEFFYFCQGTIKNIDVSIDVKIALMNVPSKN
jgi:hypothetical protein